KEIAVQNVGSDQDVWRAPISSSSHSLFVCFTPDGQTVLTEVLNGNQRVLRRWARSTGKPAGQLTISDDRASRLITFAPDGRSLAMAARGGHSLELRDAGTEELVRVFGSAVTGTRSGGQANAALRKQLVES